GASGGGEEMDVSGLYDARGGLGVGYGTTFRRLQAAWRADGAVYAEIELDGGTDVTGFGVHPALLDSALHALGFTLDEQSRQPLLPFSWAGVSLFATGASAARVRLTPTGPRSLEVVIADPT